jgi:hypothetical protein
LHDYKTRKMKKTALIISAIILISGYVSGQDSTAYTKDTLASKMKIYMSMLDVANVYAKAADEELVAVKEYKSSARLYLDSSYIFAQKAEIDPSKAQLYLLQFNYAYEMANKLIEKAETQMLVVNAYKDSATQKNKDAEAYYLQLVDKYKSLIEGDTTHPVNYTVQLGAGNMDLDYFSKAGDYEVITPSDGIKRFVAGNFKSIDDAMAYKQKMIDLGYFDAFIRSMESLNY